MDEDYIKGPWHTGGFQNLVVNDANNETVLACPGGRTLKENKARSALMAAAPCMLKALKLAMPYLNEDLERCAQDGGYEAGTDPEIDADIARLTAVIEAAEKAISKAEGYTGLPPFERKQGCAPRYLEEGKA